MRVKRDSFGKNPLTIVSLRDKEWEILTLEKSKETLKIKTLSKDSWETLFIILSLEFCVK